MSSRFHVLIASFICDIVLSIYVAISLLMLVVSLSHTLTYSLLLSLSACPFLPVDYCLHLFLVL